MSAFGIKVITQNTPDRFYVGKDDALWDWLNASNFGPSEFNQHWLIVPAPEGYAFHYGNMFPVEELKDADETGRNILVWAKTPFADKADMMLETLKQVERDEFFAEKIPQHRIMDVRNIKDIPRTSGTA